MRSFLGDPLDVRIPVTIDAGESVEPSCFKLRTEPTGDIPRMASGRVSIVRSSGTTALRIQSREAMNEPALLVGIVAACPGQSGEYRRDYSLLIDPPAAGRASSTPRAPQPGAEPNATPSFGAIAATLIARIGDTLESIAHAIFPDNRKVRQSYIEALRETNPRLAVLGDNEPIPVDTPIALPDLRTFAHAHVARHTQVAKAPRSEPPAEAQGTTATSIAAAPDAATELKAPRAPKAEHRAAPREASAPARQAKASERAPREAEPQAKPAKSPESPPPRRTREGGFVLKLSSPEVDLTRSRSIDDRQRQQLRERQMVLDQDDQVAALLALRHSVQQLETRVAELQLKLAAMPSSFPPPKQPPIAAIQPPVVSAPPPPPAPAPKPSEAPSEAKPAEAAKPAPAEAKPATPTEVKPAPPVVAERKASAAPEKGAGVPELHEVTRDEWIRYGLWVLTVLLLFAAGALAWRLVARRRALPPREEPAEERLPAPEEDDRIVVADEAPVIAAPAPQVEVAADGRRIIDADVHLTTRLGDDSDDLRRRYIEERFPEITKGAIALDDPDSVVKGARLFYEDGAIARAVELLQLAIERKPAEVKTWLALFEIFRLERLAGEFAQLARRFKEHHGSSPFWPKVQYFGREIDPANALYQVAAVDRFETIGPAQAKRMAAAEATFDPIAENWLGAPMDFQNEVLANELRKAIMTEAGIAEPDLVPNPMPALRNIEMFTVA